jgi:precorrin-2 dehydrogenase/sirohydrochlorin ferrochelatase
VSAGARPASPPRAGKAYYPVFLDVEGRPCAVVGGGRVGTEKARKLIEHGAVLRLVAPEITEELRALVDSGSVAEYRRRPYRRGDLAGCFLAIAATDDEDVNRAVWRDAEERGLLCNVATGPPYGNFIVPGVVRRGQLAIAVSTGGASPAVARRIRRELQERYGPEWEALLGLLSDLRDDLKARYPDAERRRDAVERLMRTDVVERLAENDGEGVRALVRETLLSGR